MQSNLNVRKKHMRFSGSYSLQKCMVKKGLLKALTWESFNEQNESTASVA